MKNLMSIGVIWLGCAAAWLILGGTIKERTGESSAALNEEVQALWGPPLVQAPPTAVGYHVERRREKVEKQGPRGPETEWVEREEQVSHPVVLTASRVVVRLAFEQRRKGLLWFPTYGVELQARYTFRNDPALGGPVTFTFPLAAENAVYDGFQMAREGGELLPVTIEKAQARYEDVLAPGEVRELLVRYRSRGTGRFTYALTAGTGQVRDFALTMETDFPAVDFPAGTLSPSRHETRNGTWRGEWRFESLVGSQQIGLDLPQRLNPGPLAARLTFFAPIGLLFFFFVVAQLAAVVRRPIHPLNYLFLGCAFFAFHLLFGYLVDHVAIAPAFAASALTAVALVVTYARWFVGWRFALREIACAQLVFLVLFSVSFFFEGFTGLSITIGAILTLFVMMQITGRAGLAAQLAEAGPPAPCPAPRGAH